MGANNSGKTAILTALRHFLAESSPFGAFDISLSEWPVLRALGVKWESLTEDPATAAPKEGDNWEDELAMLLAAMPTLDLWFDAEAGMFHYVQPFLSKLVWKGGAVGVRLRLEPASDVASLKELAWAYNLARQPVKGISSESLAWPIDLLDYWLREPRKMGQVKPYSLDAVNNPIQGIKTYKTQVLAAGAQPADRKHLAKLIRVDFVAAQRGLGSEEADSKSTSSSHPVGLFSNQLLKFARQHLNVAVTGHGQRADLIQAVANAQKDLDLKIHEALASSVAEVKMLGYPGLHDPQEIRFRTRIHTANLLDHSTAVQYSMKGGTGEDMLPEFSIGLGYQNLQSLSYQLVSFKTARMNPENGSPPPVHLVMIEEPEAHLHVQVQRIFPDKAHKLISPTDSDASALQSQLLISTHSSHLAHAEDFDRLRYVRRIPASTSYPTPSTEVVDLGEVFGNDEETRQFAERYFRVQHTDLLFANAALFVAGSTGPLHIAARTAQLDELSARAEGHLVPLRGRRDAAEAGDGALPRLAHQALLYPVTDLAAATPSYARVTTGLPLTAATMHWFIGHYTPDASARGDWRASPAKAASLAGVAPAFVLTVAHDPLCDEGQAYAKRLSEAGVRVTTLHCSDQMHGLLGQGRLVSAAATVADQAFAAIGHALGAAASTSQEPRPAAPPRDD